MKIERIELKQLVMPLVAPFETSFGRQTEKSFILVSVTGDGVTGYAESVSMAFPFYNEETTETNWYMLEHFLIPLLFSHDISHPEDLSPLFKRIRRNYMAKASLEGAVWDLYAKQQGKSLARSIGGVKTEIEVGVSIGIEPTSDEVLKKVDRFLSEGYKKIKVKIKPGFDIEPIARIRKEFGDDVPLMADANSAYQLSDIDIFKELDRFNLLMIEQPLGHEDIIDHAKLQRQMKTPICLDESIHSVDDAVHAVELGSCKIINIKIGRVGGIHESVKIHDYCKQHNIPVWCGGMLESGIGRAHNIAIASLDHFIIPGDTSASNRYWKEDIVEPEVVLVKPGILAVPTKPGIGYEIRPNIVKNYTVRQKTFDNTNRP
jgi:O-succinylbenzoate synthase